MRTSAESNQENDEDEDEEDEEETELVPAEELNIVWRISCAGEKIFSRVQQRPLSVTEELHVK